MPIARSCIVCGARTDGGPRCPAHEHRGHLLPRPCIACGATVAGHGNYCPACELELERRRSAEREASGKREHYKGHYRARSDRIRRRAYAGLERCWLCGEGNRYDARGQLVKWHVDHVDPGNPASELRAAHAPCNIARGNRAR